MTVVSDLRSFSFFTFVLVYTVVSASGISYVKFLATNFLSFSSAGKVSIGVKTYFRLVTFDGNSNFTHSSGLVIFDLPKS